MGAWPEDLDPYITPELDRSALVVINTQADFLDDGASPIPALKAAPCLARPCTSTALLTKAPTPTTGSRRSRQTGDSRTPFSRRALWTGPRRRADALARRRSLLAPS